jgi:hypothetical protein
VHVDDDAPNRPGSGLADLGDQVVQPGSIRVAGWGARGSRRQCGITAADQDDGARCRTGHHGGA